MIHNGTDKRTICLAALIADFKEVIYLTKRKDSRGIMLQTGESQNASGRYRYRYVDNEGCPHDVYAWRLRPEDPTPEGKRPALSLRELKKQIQKDLDDNLRAWQGNITLNKLIKEYIDSQIPYWEPGTVDNYLYYQKRIAKDTLIGAKKVSKLTSDHIEKFYDRLLLDKEKPLKIASVNMVDCLVRPALQMAVRKNIIRTNPAEGVLTQLKKKCPESASDVRHALEEEQQRKLLDFIKTDYLYSQFYSLFYLLAWTGCRINELLALAWQDIDFRNEIIHVRRSLSYKKKNGKHCFILKPPKTEHGIREIPMLADVKQILQEMKRKVSGDNIIEWKQQTRRVSVDNMEDFLFLNQNGNFYQYHSIDRRLKCILERYNKSHEEKLADVVCHTFRHNFCCWLCENIEGNNSADDIKYIQSIMGHSDVSTTLNIYSEMRKENKLDKHESLKRKAAQRK